MCLSLKKISEDFVLGLHLLLNWVPLISWWDFIKTTQKIVWEILKPCMYTLCTFSQVINPHMQSYTKLRSSYVQATLFFLSGTWSLNSVKLGIIPFPLCWSEFDFKSWRLHSILDLSLLDALSTSSSHNSKHVSRHCQRPLWRRNVPPPIKNYYIVFKNLSAVWGCSRLFVFFIQGSTALCEGLQYV